MSSILLQGRGRHTSSWDTDNTTITTATLALSFRISSLPTTNHHDSLWKTRRTSQALCIAAAESCKATMVSSPPSVPLMLIPPVNTFMWQHFLALHPLMYNDNKRKNILECSLFMASLFMYSLFIDCVKPTWKSQALHTTWIEMNS